MEDNMEKKRGGFAKVVLILAVLWIIGSLLGEKDSSYSVPKEYGWVVGIWTCNTPYGIQTYSLANNGAFSDNDGHKGSFTIESGRIYTHLDGTLGYAIEIDKANRRIGPGGGYWMTKVSK